MVWPDLILRGLLILLIFILSCASKHMENVKQGESVLTYYGEECTASVLLTQEETGELLHLINEIKGYEFTEEVGFNPL